MNDLLRKALPRYLQLAADTFNKDGFHVPMLFLSSNGEVVLVPITCPLTPTLKDRLSDMLASLAGQGLTEFLFVTEAWFVEGDLEDGSIIKNAPANRLHSHPARKEMLMVTYNAPKHAEVYRAEILRPPGGEPRVGDWKSNASDRQQGSMAHTGRFSPEVWDRALAGNRVN